jgi:hypothetical protein
MTQETESPESACKYRDPEIADGRSDNSVPENSDSSPKGKHRLRRGCLSCLGCLGIVLLLGFAFLLWIDRGAAPEPLACLSPDSTIRFQLQNPSAVISQVLKDKHLSDLLELDKELISDKLLLIELLAGKRAAMSLSGKDKVALACQPGFLGRCLARLIRLAGNSEVNMVGKTLLRSKNSAELKAISVLGRKLLQVPSAGQQEPGNGFELLLGAGETFSELKVKKHDWRVLAYLSELPANSLISGRLSGDSALGRFKGQLVFKGLSAQPMHPLADGLPGSSALFPQDTLLYWVWNAPVGSLRWDNGGRLAEFMHLWGKDLLETLAKNASPDSPEIKYMEVFKQINVLLIQQSCSERALAFNCQSDVSGGIAVSFALRLLDPQKTSSALLELAKMLIPESKDGQAPSFQGRQLYPYYALTVDKNGQVLKIVFAPPGPEYGLELFLNVSGKYLLISTSGLQLREMAAGAHGRHSGDTLMTILASDSKTQKGSNCCGRLILNPAGREDVISGAIKEFGAWAGGQELTTEQNQTLSRIASVLNRFRRIKLSWFSGLPKPESPETGSIEVIIDAQLVTPLMQ